MFKLQLLNWDFNLYKNKINYFIWNFEISIKSYLNYQIKITGNQLKERRIENIRIKIAEAKKYLSKNPARALKLAKKIKQFSEGNPEIDGYAEFLLGSALRNLGDWNSALIHFENSLTLRSEHKDRDYSLTLAAAGKCYYYTGNSEKAIKYLTGALSIQEKVKDYYEKCRTLIFIANVYEIFTKDHKRTISLYNEALVLSRKIKSKNFEASSYGGISSVYFNMGKFSRAIEMLLKSEKIYSKPKDDYMLSQVYAELGRCNYELRKFKEAINYFLKLLSAAARLKNINVRFEALSNLAVCYYETGEYSLMEKYRKLLKKYLNNIQDKVLVYDYYRTFAEVYFNKGEFEKAFEFHKRYTNEYIRFRDEQIERQMKQLMLSFEKERAEKEAEILRLRNNELRKEIETKTKELNNSANYIVQKNEFINSIFDEINTYIKKTDIGRHHRDNLLKFLSIVESRNRLNKEMVSFESRLNTLNLEFVKKLSKKFQALSPVELKICSMMKINLGTKEIAKLLFISPRTVETHRHHIIKKLKLPKSQNLLGFINTI